MSDSIPTITLSVIQSKTRAIEPELLSFLADKVARFLFEFHADDYKRLGLPVLPPFASSGTIHKLLKTRHVCI